MGEHIDLNVSGILNGEETLSNAGRRISSFAIDVAFGRLMKAE
jgi:altronate dehydratase